MSRELERMRKQSMAKVEATQNIIQKREAREEPELVPRASVLGSNQNRYLFYRPMLAASSTASS